MKPVKELIKKFSSAYQFCNSDLNKLVLLLRKGVYPYEEYMDSWESFNETSLLDKKDFYELNNGNITDKDYQHYQKVWEIFEIKNLVQYHVLYVQSDTLLLAHVFEN